MAGHSKFKNIQHRKGAQDKKRAKIFNKIAREITVAAKMGGGDPDMNPRLRLAMNNARSANMPKDRIERAIKVATETGQGDDYDEIRYEGYGVGGVAVIVEALTDNRNRTVAEVRTAFSKNGGTLGESNSVAFMFDRVGAIVYPLSAGGEDTMFEAAIEAGAENVETDDEMHTVYTAADDFGSALDVLTEKLGEPESSGLVWRPQNLTEVSEAHAETMLKMIDALEDDDDVQNVFTNMDIPDELMEKLSAE